ncbi:MAG TPA: tyrosine-type recombinase/integrase [Terracidiphilus sp.]|jgi:site-specific recombinase XerD|nr:tyrosine-type recombinase/integrase [Terracidiphilus sp.]
MLETHLNSPVTQRRLRTGLVADHIDGFADWLRLHGYKPISIANSLRSLAGWADWMRAAGFTAQSVLPGFEACKMALQTQKRALHSRGPNHHSLTAAATFIQFLQQQGKLPPTVPPPSITDRWPVLGEFRLWMRQHRGLTETTLDVYQWILVRLMDVLGDDASSYSAETLRAFVLDQAYPHGTYRATSIVVAVRSFIRFLAATGRCRAGLEQAIPGFASWKLSSVPRFLVAEDVERVIGSCNTHVFGLRDRAVLLLLARLGLRASEVAQLKFADIDWRNGGITVCGKGRRQESLPLPQEVGNAILHYLNQARPPLRVPEVFTTVLAPIHPLTRATVTHIVRSALRRAGIKAPVNGAHLLRHSAATSMLRNGVPLAGVGAILRHRSPMTTAHYAKVDFGLLAEIAQPWPEAPSC